MDGIYISPTEFVSFSELENQVVDRNALLNELYADNFLSGFDPAGWLGLLPDPDPVLRKTGDGVSFLRTLTADDKVLSCMQNRKLGILKKKDFLYEPGKAEGEDPTSDAINLCDDLKKDLERVDLYNVFSQVLDAPYYGLTAVEIIWEAENGKLRIKNLKPRPTEWFAFNAEHDPVFRGSDSTDGDPIPYGKVVIARHFPDAVNPYGLRLLSRCLWPVAIKKGGIRFWTILCERFGIPWVIGKVPRGAGETKRIKTLNALVSMVQDAVAVVSSGTEVDIHSLEGKGEGIHSKLIQYMDASIARALMGQNLTSEGKNTGTYAESQTVMEALQDFQEADETLVVKFMRDLGYIYTQVNNPSAAYPSFRYREPEDYQAQAGLDKKLHEVGVRFKPEHFSRRYNLADDEFYLEEGTTGNEENGDNAELSAPTGSEFTPEQRAIEDLVSEAAKDGEEALKKSFVKIKKIIDGAKSFEEAQTLLMKMFPDIEPDALASTISQALFAADMWGRYTVNQEGEDEG